MFIILILMIEDIECMDEKVHLRLPQCEQMMELKVA